jgi:hypothetical protein
MPKYYILMGDVIKSRERDVKKLRMQLKGLLSACNRHLEADVLSPYTTTLGDEFQGVASNLRGLLEAVFYLEEVRLKKQYSFKLRYVAHFGHIQTPINREIAYEMMGPGLTRARRLLTDKRRGRPRFVFDLSDRRLSRNLNLLCSVVDGLTARWRLQDYLLIYDMVSNDNNEEVGRKHGKNRSQIWKRRKHLLIDEYKAVKEVIFELTGEV